MQFWPPGSPRHLHQCFCNLYRQETSHPDTARARLRLHCIIAFRNRSNEIAMGGSLEVNRRLRPLRQQPMEGHRLRWAITASRDQRRSSKCRISLDKTAAANEDDATLCSHQQKHQEPISLGGCDRRRDDQEWTAAGVVR